MIEFKNIALKVHQQTLLDRTDLLVAPGDKVVIRGPSGCGKSSLLKCVAGALPLTEGFITVNGQEMNAVNVAAIRSLIAFIGQEPVLGAGTVRESLLLPFSYRVHRHNHPDEKRIIETLEQLHLSADILEKPSKRISGGEKQRIAIARAMLLNKTIFLADEVTSALDPESKAAVMEELFKPEITLLSVSHDADWIRACSRQIVISDHKLEESVADQHIENSRNGGTK